MKWIFISSVFMKLVRFISPRQRLGDIKHKTCFIKTVWNEIHFRPYLYGNMSDKVEKHKVEGQMGEKSYYYQMLYINITLF